jgi:quercetin dioxygenase-like cupin family protein
MRARAAVGIVAVLAPLTIFQRAVSVEQEPQHHLVLVNDYVRVLDVVFPPGYTTLFHTHALDNVSVRLTGGISRTDRLDAQGTPAPVIPGSVAFNSASPPYTHRIENTGATAIHIHDIQLVKATPPATVPDDLDGHEIVIDNDRVRVSRIKLSAGKVLSAHSHPRGWVESVVSGLNPGALTWRGPGQTTALGGPAATEIIEVQPK